MTNLGEYNKFLESKQKRVGKSGFEPTLLFNSNLFDFQLAIIKWSLRLGKSAIFADCGLGKGIMQLEWSKHVADYTHKPVLIISPLAVTDQTIAESEKFGYSVTYVRNTSDLLNSKTPVVITNFEMIKEFDTSLIGGIVLDESSILKNETGEMRNLMIAKAAQVKYRLSLSATPAPNDYPELGNQAEFLGICTRDEMLVEFFVNNMTKTEYRIKGHAVDHFWSWVVSWAVMLSKPSDIGDFDDSGYELPELQIKDICLSVDHHRAFDKINSDGQAALLLVGNTSATDMHREKRETVNERMAEAARVANECNDYAVVWVETDYEADIVKRLIPDCVEVRGSEPREIKAKKLNSFSRGETRVLVTKPKIAAFGMNWQHCNISIDASVTHKFESWYQRIRRFYRFGQERNVHNYVIYAESEISIVENVYGKMKSHIDMQKAMIDAMRRNGMSVDNQDHKVFSVLNRQMVSGRNWEFYNGDSVDTISVLADNTVQMWVESPPFEDLYTYSDSPRDLGNCRDSDEFTYQYSLIVNEQYRTTKNNGFKCVHCRDLPLSLEKNGIMGLSDFPGRIIKTHIEAGYKFYAWKTVWKSPVTEQQRTKSAGLGWQHAFCKRAERARQGAADYVLVFQKSDNDNVFNSSQLPMSVRTVERCLDLWSNKSDLVITPFTNNHSDLQVGLIIVDSTDNPVNYIPAIRTGRLIVARYTHPIDMTKSIGDMGMGGMTFHSRLALNDGSWLVAFRKWGNNMPNDDHVVHKITQTNHKYIGRDYPIQNKSNWNYSVEVWQRYASCIWYDIEDLPESHIDIWWDVNQSNVLNFRNARTERDEKHLCPLQLDVIEKCVDLYTDKGDLVASAFGGIASEPVTAIKMGRKAWGCELKESYWRLGVSHLREVERELETPSLFTLFNISV